MTCWRTSAACSARRWSYRMSDERTTPESPDGAVMSTGGDGATPSVPSAEALAARVHTSFAKSRKWGDVPVGVVREVIAGLDLEPDERRHPTPRLRVERLRFEGEKTLKD